MKIVMVVNKELPLGLVANTTAVLGISIGSLFGEIVGCDIQDADGHVHLGITTKIIPILGGSKEQIKSIRDNTLNEKYSDLTVVDFSEVAQKCVDYENYMRILSSLHYSEIYYLGICIYGPVKQVNKLTGNIGLLR